MRRLSRLAAALRALLRRGRVEEDLDEELHAFLEASMEAKIAAGAPPSEARQAAMREMGSQTFARDIRYAFRLIGRDRRFTAVAVLTLALGIGVNTAIFTLADGMLFRPLPYGDPARLVLIQPYDPKTGQMYGRLDRVDVEEIAAHHSGFAGVSLIEAGPSYTWLGADGTDSIGSTTITSNVLVVLGVGAALGRSIVPGDERVAPRPASYLPGMQAASTRWRRSRSSNVRRLS